MTMAIMNTIMELMVALLPLPIVFSLNMSRRQRWGVVGILSLGVTVFVVGCVRCWFIYHGFLETWDISWWSGPHWTVSEVENSLALLCACIPALRPVLGRILKKNTNHQRHQGVDSLTLVSRSVPTPTIKSKHQVVYPSGANVVWFDLEGIADDGMAYTINIQPNGRESHEPSRNNRHRAQVLFLGRNGQSPTAIGATSSNDSTGYIVQPKIGHHQEYYAEKGGSQEMKILDDPTSQQLEKDTQTIDTSPDLIAMRPAQRQVSKVRRLGEPPRPISRQIATRTSSRRRGPANPMNTSQILP